LITKGVQAEMTRLELLGRLSVALLIASAVAMAIFSVIIEMHSR